MNDAKVRALLQIRKELPDPDFIRSMDPAAFADFVSKVRNVVLENNLRPEDLRGLNPHPGDLVVDWVRKRMVPRPTDRVDPGMYFRALRAILRASSPFLLPNHVSEFHKTVSEHVVDHIIDVCPDPDWFKHVRGLMERNGVGDFGHLDALVFQNHRDLAVEHYLEGNLSAAAEHVHFLYSVFGDRVHELDRKFPYDTGFRLVSPLQETARRLLHHAFLPDHQVRTIKKYVGR